MYPRRVDDCGVWFLKQCTRFPSWYCLQWPVILRAPESLDTLCPLRTGRVHPAAVSTRGAPAARLQWQQVLSSASRNLQAMCRPGQLPSLTEEYASRGRGRDVWILAGQSQCHLPTDQSRCGSANSRVIHPSDSPIAEPS